MNTEQFLTIMKQVKEKQPNYGSITIEMVFHDGQLKHYILNQCERHNVDNSTGNKR